MYVMSIFVSDFILCCTSCLKINNIGAIVDKIVYYALECTNKRPIDGTKPQISKYSTNESNESEFKEPTSPTNKFSAPRTPKSSKLKNSKSFSEIKSSPQKLRISWFSTRQSNDSIESISLSTWLIVCKLIAAYQTHHTQPSKKLLKSLFISPTNNLPKQSNNSSTNNTASHAFPQLEDDAKDPSSPLSSDGMEKGMNLNGPTLPLKFANFNIHRVPTRFTAGVFMKDFSIEISGWQVCGEEDSFSGRQHVKFKVSSVAQISYSMPDIDPVDRTTKPFKQSETSSSHDSLAERNVVERRYSDFEALVAIMQKNHKGCVIPPLPEKQWGHNFLTTPLTAAAESMVRQRALELQLFANDLMQHPMLRYSFELQVFLESSAAGFKAFVGMHRNMLDDTGEVIVRRRSSSEGAKLFFAGNIGFNGILGKGNSDYYDQSSQGNTGDVTKMIADTIVSGAQYMVANSPVSYGYISSIWGMVSKSVPVMIPTPSTAISSGSISSSMSSGSGSSSSPSTSCSPPSSAAVPWRLSFPSTPPGNNSNNSNNKNSKNSFGSEPVSSPSSIQLDSKQLDDAAKKMEFITNVNKKMSAWMSAEVQYSSDLSKIGHSFQNVRPNTYY